LFFILSEERKLIIVIERNSKIDDLRSDLLSASLLNTELILFNVVESTKSHHSSQCSKTWALVWAAVANQSRIHHNLCSIFNTDSRSIWCLCPWTMLFVFILAFSEVSCLHSSFKALRRLEVSFLVSVWLFSSSRSLPFSLLISSASW